MNTIAENGPVALERAVLRSRMLPNIKGACVMYVDGEQSVEALVNGRPQLFNAVEFLRLINNLGRAVA